VVPAVTDPEVSRLLAEANVTGFALIRYMLECGSEPASTAEVAQRVLRYEADVLAARGQVGQHLVAVTPAQTLLFAQLAASAARAFTGMVQTQAGRRMSQEELLAEFSKYEELLLLGGSL
jgi:hypothetical protein